MYFKTGTIIGNRYKISEVLGSGGMATVYLASATNNPEFKVALKIFYPGIIKSAEAKERFRTEVLAAYRVSHENVVQIYECFDENNVFAFALEYADSGDLYKKLELGKLKESETIEIMKQAATGLNAIHAADIVHRDLKPENILLTSKGGVKISDFGVARMTGLQTPTQSGHIVGTPRYVSPEYVVTGCCDARSDIFALGLIAFEMLTKHSPFPDHQGEVLSKIRFDPSMRFYLKDFKINCSKEFEAIIERSLAIHVNSRYQSTDELIYDLTMIQNDQPFSDLTLNYYETLNDNLKSDWKKVCSRDFTPSTTNSISKVSPISVINLIIGVALIVVMIWY